MGEVERVRAVYARYHDDGRSARWAGDHGILDERHRLLAELLATVGGPTPRVLDLGCGRGDLVDELADLGVDPSAIVGVDLLADRVALARSRGRTVALASGAALPFADDSFDVVTAFTVLSSVGDDAVLAAMAGEVGRVLAPGGRLVVYDLRVPSPGNRAVRALPRRRLRALFPGWTLRSRTCTLVPPLARRLAPEPGARYDRLAALPPLRTHRLTALGPPSAGATPPGDGLQLGPLPARPRLSVVMPVRDEARFIERSLGAVLDQDVDADVEVVVVDGHSGDDTPRVVREVAAVHGRAVAVLDNPARIVPVSMNLGLARATGDVVVRVDGHCVIAPDYLRRCLDVLRSTGASCVGGPMETVGETPTARAIAAAQSSRFGVGGVAFRTASAAADVDTLAFGAYRREVFDRIGAFDEALVRNQDDELNLRLTRAGGRIRMDPAIRSTYFSRGTLAGLWRQYHGYGFYKVAVMRKHRTVPAVRHLVPAAFVASLIAAGAVSAGRRSPWPLAALGATYGTAVGASSLGAARRAGDAPVATVAAATVAMHLAYGTGWWAGLVRAIGPGRPRPQPVGSAGPRRRRSVAGRAAK